MRRREDGRAPGEEAAGFGEAGWGWAPPREVRM